MGVLPYFPQNIEGDCTCTSVFDIEIRTLVYFSNQDEPQGGTLSLSGEICPDCNNRFSDFNLTFIDEDPINNGDQSFTLIPYGINVPFCGVIENNLVQSVDGIGLYVPVEGEPQLVCFDLTFQETLNGDDTFSVSLSRRGTNRIVLIPQTTVPDDSITVTECSG